MHELPDDWRQPAQVWLEKQWAEHREREELENRSRERDEHGVKRWQLVREVTPDGWVEIRQKPAPESDPRRDELRAPIRAAVWPLKSEENALKDAQAIADESAAE